MKAKYGDYSEQFRQGRFVAAMKWPDLDALWDRVKKQADDDWYVHAIGEQPPDTTVGSEKVAQFIDEIDALLHRDHDEDYCGIVYADDHTNPSMIKIFDPNNLGVSCGYSDNPPPPGWVLSKFKPVPLEDVFPQPGNRRRWWQKIFD